MNILRRFLPAGNIEVASAWRARANEDRVPVFRQQCLQAVDTLAGAELDTEVEDVAAFFVNHRVGQPEFGDLRSDHAARFRVAVENDAMISERSKIAGNGKGGWAAADEGDAFAVFLCRGFWQAVANVVLIVSRDS